MINQLFTADYYGDAKVTRYVIRLATFVVLLCSLCAGADESSSAGQLENSPFLLKVQSTYIWQEKPAFYAAYSGPHSLSAGREKSYTFSGTAYFGARLWQGAEIFANPEVTQGVPLSGLTGLAGPTNGESQKVSGTNPTFYRARFFMRQTIGFGGDQQKVEEGFNQFAGVVDQRRLVVTLGNFALNDIFDNNAFAHDPRTQFMNWTIMDYGAWDFAADARGFTTGAATEWYYDDWAVRFARAELPIESNQLTLNAQIFRSYGDNFEIEQAHTLFDRPGKISALAYRNVAKMGTYGDANALATQTETAPDISLVRKSQAKTGFGASFEQTITGDLGLFGRFSKDDGQGEEFAYTEVDRSLAAGASLNGVRWQRADDTVGLAMVHNNISDAHRKYLAAGGLGFFLGDGALTRYREEETIETYYSAKLLPHLWATLDYQHINNPGYNLQRGPVNVWSTRLHIEL